MKTEQLPPTNWSSPKTYESVKNQILERFGPKLAESYDPTSNCRTFNDWSSAGYTVNSGAKSLKSVIIIEKKDKSGKVVSKHAKTVNLFLENQVHKLK